MSHPVSPHDDALHLIGGQAHDEANSLGLRYQHIYIYTYIYIHLSYILPTWKTFRYKLIKGLTRLICCEHGVEPLLRRFLLVVREIPFFRRVHDAQDSWQGCIKNWRIMNHVMFFESLCYRFLISPIKLIDNHRICFLSRRSSPVPSKLSFQINFKKKSNYIYLQLPEFKKVPNDDLQLWISPFQDFILDVFLPFGCVRTLWKGPVVPLFARKTFKKSHFLQDFLWAITSSVWLGYVY